MRQEFFQIIFSSWVPICGSNFFTCHSETPIGSLLGCLDTTVDKSVEKLSGGGCGGPRGGFGGPGGGFLILVAVVACHYFSYH